MQILVLLGMYFDAVMVFVTSQNFYLDWLWSYCASLCNICCLFTLSTNIFMLFMPSYITHIRVIFFLKTHFNASFESISPQCVTYIPKLQNQLPHHWKVHDFNPGSSFCDHCGSVLHGLKGQGLKCSCIF